MNEPSVRDYLTGAADLRQAAEEAGRRGNPDARDALNLANALDRVAEDEVFGG